MKNNSKRLTPQQMYKEIKRISSFKRGYEWLLELAHRHKFDIKNIEGLPIETWIEIAHIECARKRRENRKIISNHQHVFKKSQGSTAPYTGYTKIVSIPMGGQKRR